jgi:hypothetical protein
LQPPTLDALLPDATSSQRWRDAQRLEAFAGEVRVNRIRLIAILIFYTRHLIDVYVAKTAAAGGRYHTTETLIVQARAAIAVRLHWRLSARRVGEATKFIAVAWDLAMVTAICAAAGGAKTPLVLLYFVIIATAPLRLSLRLVYFATIGAGVCYLLLLAYYAWYLVGWDRYYSTPELQIPRSEQAIFVLSLVACGVLAGQVVRQARRLVIGYPVAIAQEHAQPGEG